MGVYKNNKTNKWEWVEVVDGKQIRRMSKKWVTKKLAQENLDIFLNEQTLSETSINASPLFETVGEEYMNNKSLSLKASSLTRMKQTYDLHIKPNFIGMHIAEINVKTIQKWQHLLLKRTIQNKNKPLSNKYLELIQGIMKDILNFARVYGYISLNPLEMTPLASHRTYTPKKIMTILTFEQFDRFLSVVEDKTDRLVYMILYWCGLRSGELIALDIGDYSAENKTIHVYRTYDTKNNLLTTTKTDHDRIVELPDIVVKDLNELLATYPSQRPDYALLGYHTRLPKQTMANRKLNHWLKVNGITQKQYKEHLSGESIIDEFSFPWFTFHELRHTHVSTLIDLGWESKDISERLGHSVREVEETYGHLFPKRKREMFDKLNSLGNNK